MPTHFFKVILGQCKAVRDEEPTYTLGAFVMPNSPIDSQTALTAFAVPLYQLEAVSGEKAMPDMVAYRWLSAFPIRCSQSDACKARRF